MCERCTDKEKRIQMLERESSTQTKIINQLVTELDAKVNTIILALQARNG